MQYARVGTKGVKPDQWVGHRAGAPRELGRGVVPVRAPSGAPPSHFALARFLAAEVTEAAFVPPADEALRAQITMPFGRFDRTRRSRRSACCSPRRSPTASECQWDPSQRAIMRKDGSLELRFRTCGMYEVERWGPVVGWGCPVWGRRDCSRASPTRYSGWCSAAVAEFADRRWRRALGKTSLEIRVARGHRRP